MRALNLKIFIIHLELKYIKVEDDQCYQHNRNLCDFNGSTLGVTVGANMDVFWESSEEEGGSFPIQKITLQILLVSKRYIWERKKVNVISKKGGRGRGVIANPKNFIANLRILNGFSGKKSAM